MKNHDGCERGFFRESKSWHWKETRNHKENERITFGMFHVDGGTTGEMAIVWRNLGWKSVPQLIVFDDGWSALSQFIDVVSKMGEHDGENICPDEFVKILLGRGFKDMTNYTSPYEEGNNK